MHCVLGYLRSIYFADKIEGHVEQQAREGTKFTPLVMVSEEIRSGKACNAQQS